MPSREPSVCHLPSPRTTPSHVLCGRVGVPSAAILVRPTTASGHTGEIIEFKAGADKKKKKDISGQL